MASWWVLLRNLRRNLRIMRHCCSRWMTVALAVCARGSHPVEVLRPAAPVPWVVVCSLSACGGAEAGTLAVAAAYLGGGFLSFGTPADAGQHAVW